VAVEDIPDLTGCFRAQNKALVTESFVKILELAQALKLAKFGQVTVSIDDTKIAANLGVPGLQCEAPPNGPLPLA
jgi:hypothetical protein